MSTQREHNTGDTGLHKPRKRGGAVKRIVCPGCGKIVYARFGCRECMQAGLVNDPNAGQWTVPPGRSAVLAGDSFFDSPPDPPEVVEDETNL